MEEKERYGLDEVLEIIYDNHEKYYPTEEKICNLLNEQDKENKKLCQQIINLNKENNKLLKFKEDILRVQAEPYQFYKENQQLKEEVEENEEYIKYNIPKLIEANKQLSQSQKQFAIEKLETLQNSIIIFKQVNSDMSLTINYIEQIINNQILELKGEE